MIMMIIGSISESRDRKSRERASAAAGAQDSIRWAAVITRPDTATLEGVRFAEAWLRKENRHSREHSALHQRFITTQLGELHRFVQARPVNIAAASAIVATIDTFYSAEQRATFRRDTASANAARRRADEAAIEQTRIAAVAARKAYAEKLERTYLDKGMDVTVTTRGNQSTTLRLKWILVSRVVAHQFSQNGEIFATLRSLGFKRLEISDGYDEEWYWTIN